MSVSNIVSSFNSTAFFKVGGEMLQQMHMPTMALAVGAGMGITACLIGDIRRINNEAPDYSLKNGINERTTRVFNIWGATSLLAYAGLLFSHRNFVILTVAGSIHSWIFLRSINKALSHRTFQGDTQEKLVGAVNRALQILVPTAAALTCLLLARSSEVQKV